MTSLPFHHVGYVVDDLDAAVADAVALFGAGPFYVAEPMAFEELTGTNSSPGFTSGSPAPQTAGTAAILFAR